LVAEQAETELPLRSGYTWVDKKVTYHFSGIVGCHVGVFYGKRPDAELEC